MRIPRVGFVICNSGSSNSGYITGLVATRILTEFGEDAGICSLPAIANKVPRQIAVVKRTPHIIVVDGCHKKCASKILYQLGIHYDASINLENLGIKRLGPFTTLKYHQDDLGKVYRVLASRMRDLLNKRGEAP